MFNMHNKKKIEIKLFINSFFILVNIAIKSTYKLTRGEIFFFLFFICKKNCYNFVSDLKNSGKIRN
jgi:hypothetical protein